MSSKVFEYLQAGRPVFAISPAGSAARGALRGGRRRHLRAARRAHARAAAGFLAARRAGTAPDADPTAFERYELRSLTADPAALLNELAGQPATSGPARGGGDGRTGRMRA